jgi:multidrug efflux pump subunit AcrA (membrane-fusion protein)
MNKTVLGGLALLMATGGVTLAIPSVRNFIDNCLPSLGINGYSGRSNATVRFSPPLVSSMSDSEETPGKLVDIDRSFNPTVAIAQESEPTAVASGSAIADSVRNPAIIQLVQATLPPSANQTGVKDTSNSLVVPRLSQVQEKTSLPSEGLNVPAASMASTISVPDASLTFVRDREVTAQANGIIFKLPVDDGSIVNEGDLLVELDTRVADAEVRVQTKELEQAKLKASDNSSVQYAEKASAVARVESEISDRLLREWSEDLSTNQKKRLEYEKSRLQINVSNIEHAKDEAAVGVSEAKLEAAKVQVVQRQITANFGGIVSDVKKEPFDYVREGETILRVTDMQRIRVKGRVNLTNSNVPPHLLLNAPAKVTVIAPGISKRIDGVVGYVAPFTGGVANVYPIWVEIANEKLADGQFLLREGMNATIELFPKRSLGSTN